MGIWNLKNIEACKNAKLAEHYGDEALENAIEKHKAELRETIEQSLLVPCDKKAEG